MFELLGLTDLLSGHIGQLDPVFEDVISDPVSVLVRSNIASALHVLISAWRGRLRS